jgi:hypothetical protein
MQSLNKQLDLIKEKFPQKKKRIEELYGENEDFRSLCSDYILCIQQLERFKTEFGEKQLSLKEFLVMQTELERELYNLIFSINL